MLQITDKAVAELQEILAGPDMPAQGALRVFANTSGCCASNELGIEITDQQPPNTIVMQFKGLQVFVDQDALDIASRATIDFFDHPENAGFKVLWHKPQEGGGCGCHG